MRETTDWACEFASGLAPRRMTLKLPDGYETPVFVHSPPAGAVVKLPVLQMHGIQSHPGWFGASSAALARAGHEVFQITRRGSGENTLSRGHADSAEQLLDDVRAACEFVLRQTGRDRLHMVGISWGGKLLACYCANPGRASKVASLTLVAPGIVPRVDVSPAKKLAIAWSLLTNPARPFDIPLNDVELFTDNPAMGEYLRRDPLRLRQASAKFLYASMVLDIRLRKSGDRKSGDRHRFPKAEIGVSPRFSSKSESVPDFPVTLLLAGRDRIIDNSRTRSLVEKLCGGNQEERGKRGLTPISALGNRISVSSAEPCLSPLSPVLRVVELDAAHTMEFEEDPAEFLRALTAAVGE